MYSHSWIQLILVAVKVSCHCCVIIVFDVKNVTLESVNDSNFSCPTYLMWHQLHSKQYIRLLLSQVPLVIVL